jgi:uncharacterized protein (DUF342 family)
MKIVERDAHEGSSIAVRAESVLQNINNTLLQNNDIINKIIEDLISIEKLADRVAKTMEVSASVSSVSVLMDKVAVSANKFSLNAKSQLDFMKKFSL